MSERLKYSCPNCDSDKIAMEKRPGGWFRCQDCHYSWQPYPVRFGFDAPPRKQTLFDRITASEETLAEKLVYLILDCDGFVWWASTLCGSILWKTKAEAIAATVVRLKEVGDGND